MAKQASKQEASMSVDTSAEDVGEEFDRMEMQANRHDDDVFAPTHVGRTPQPQPPQVRAVVDKFAAIERELNARFINREDVIHGALLALVTRQHICLLGLPGNAKSEVVDAVRERIVGAEAFKILMSRFTTPEELFGPVSIRGLKEDRFEHQIYGYAPTSHIWFLDEPWNAGSSILNAMLMAANERQYKHDRLLMRIPLISIFGASNQMPQGEELTALWDRFTLRYWVEPLKGAALRKFMALDRDRAYAKGAALASEASEAGCVEGTTVTLAELALLQQAALQTRVPERIFDLWDAILRQLDTGGHARPSTRRVGWCQRLIAGQAMLNGRTQVLEADMSILQHALWENPKEARTIGTLVLKTAHPRLAEAKEHFDSVATLTAEALEYWKGSHSKAERSARVVETRTKLMACATSIKTLALATEREGDNADEFFALLELTKQSFMQVVGLLGTDTKPFSPKE